METAVQDNVSKTVEAVATRSNKNRIRLALFGLLIVALLAAIPVYLHYASRESTDDAEVDGHIVPISPRISGTVVDVLVNDNQQVTEGQALVKLDPADYQVALDKAEADLADAQAATLEARSNVPITDVNTGSLIRTSRSSVAEAQAGVASGRQQVDAAQSRLATAQSRLAEAQANNAKAQKDLARFKELVDKDEISKQQYDAAVAQAQSTQAQVEAAQASIQEARHNVDAATSALSQMQARLDSSEIAAQQSQANAAPEQAAIAARFKAAEATVQQKQAAVEQAKLNMQYTILRAPVTGRVSKKVAEPGMILAPGQQLMALVPLNDVWITANFKETQLKRMKVGQEVDISVDAFGGQKFKGHIDSIAAASGSRFSLLPPENATGNYVKVVQRVPVKIVLDPGEDRNHVLRPGMSVTPTVLLDSK